ncbi:MAG: GNAT family N-acetyltransferase [Bacteroidia bacterium]|nr:GNAT family N-acetyltransferase [Bacteroidia bacterium]
MEKAINIKSASNEDEEQILSVLFASFAHDPYMAYLLELSNNPNKLDILIRYITQQTLAKGRAYLTDDHKSTALWLTQRKEKFTWRFIKRNLNIYQKLGIKSIVRILKMEHISHKRFPSKSPFMYLYMIGVMPEKQGKGYAGALLDTALADADAQACPVFLETASELNVRIYEKKGFSVTHTFRDGNFMVFYMVRNPLLKE